jgi:guanylate kinase
MKSHAVAAVFDEPDAQPAAGAPRGILFVLSGPSGVGKDQAIKALKERPAFDMYHVVTATTRAMRASEVHGRDYFFVGREEFMRMQQAGELLEWARLYDDYYGTPLAQVREHLDQGTDVLLKIDVQGAAKVKQRVPDAVFIFLAPPSLEVLHTRLLRRRSEPPEKLAMRLDTASREMEALGSYDYCVVNHEGCLAQAVGKIESIVEAERCRVTRRVIDLGDA